LPSIYHSIYHITGSLPQAADLSNKSILDLAVDGTELLGEFLGLVDHLVKGHLSRGMLGRSVVATLGDDVTVVGGTTAVPGKEL